MAYKPLHSDAYPADGPYNTRMLRDVNESSQWVQENRGSHTSLTLECVGNSETDEHYIRPYASAASTSTIFRIPWYVHPDLEGIDLATYNRVSSGYLDAEDLSIPIESVEIVYRLAGDKFGNSGFTRQSPRTNQEWGWTTIDGVNSYELSAEYRDIVRSSNGFYDSIMIAIRSDVSGYLERSVTEPLTYRAAGNWSIDQDKSSPGLIRTSPNSSYTEGSSTNPPVQDANEITCSVVTSVANQITSIHDHVRRLEDTNDRGMHVWPTLHTEKDSDQWTEVGKYWIPYIQFRAIEIWETYA